MASDKRPRVYRPVLDGGLTQEHHPSTSRTVHQGQTVAIHVELWNDRPEDHGRYMTLDLTPAEAAELRDVLTWWLDPTSTANRQSYATARAEL